MSEFDAPYDNMMRLKTLEEQKTNSLSLLDGTVPSLYFEFDVKVTPSEVDFSNIRPVGDPLKYSDVKAMYDELKDLKYDLSSLKLLQQKDETKDHSTDLNIDLIKQQYNQSDKYILPIAYLDEFDRSKDYSSIWFQPAQTLVSTELNESIFEDESALNIFPALVPSPNSVPDENMNCSLPNTTKTSLTPYPDNYYFKSDPNKVYPKVWFEAAKVLPQLN